MSQGCECCTSTMTSKRKCADGHAHWLCNVCLWRYVQTPGTPMRCPDAPEPATTTTDDRPPF